METKILPVSHEHLDRYGEIYARAFNGDPWNDSWSVGDATVHVRELLENRQSHGLEYVVDGQVVGFILGASMLFHYGRVFEINDLAVDTSFQGQGIGKALLERCISDLKSMNIVAAHLVTKCDGPLPEFYEKYGFKKEMEVMLMGKELMK
jgi:ribosomal protein S18 acetylase RimI-like enzyme